MIRFAVNRSIRRQPSNNEVAVSTFLKRNPSIKIQQDKKKLLQHISSFLEDRSQSSSSSSSSSNDDDHLRRSRFRNATSSSMSLGAATNSNSHRQLLNNNGMLYTNAQITSNHHFLYQNGLHTLASPLSFDNNNNYYHNRNRIGNYNINTIQIRSISSWLPEAVTNISIWGGSGYMLKTLHMDGTIPYWACFTIINFMVRTALLPLVVYSAHMSSRFAKVAPELQFILSLFQNDMKKMRAEKRSLQEQRMLLMQNLRTVSNIYKLHKINPLSVYWSPLIQIPCFYYVAVDLRKIINGGDPQLAQQLAESSFYWIPDLTDPDPLYGLPIAAGMMLYWNVEVAVGKRSLSGPTAAKSDFALTLKDIFQSLAVFMPCFMSQSPSGIQMYVLSSFTFTLLQGAALRNESIRDMLGLPSMLTPPQDPKYATEFLEFKKLEQKAKELRGDGPLLGIGVLNAGFQTSFAGTKRPSTIQVSNDNKPNLDDFIPDNVEKTVATTLTETPKMKITPEQASAAWGGQFIHGISAPMDQLEEQIMEHYIQQEAEKQQQQQQQQQEEAITVSSNNEREYMVQPPEEHMEAANRGVVLAPPKDIDEEDGITGNKKPKQLNVEKFKRKKMMKKKKTSSSKRKR